MISPLAYVSPKAQIGKDVTIDAFAYIDDNVILGDNCHVFPHAVIGCVPQDLKFRGEETWTIIGDNCVLREFVTIHRGTASKGKTVVGNNNLIMAYCHVAHDCILHDNIIMSNATQLAGEVEVDDFAIIGGGTLVHQFTHIASHVMIQGDGQGGDGRFPWRHGQSTRGVGRSLAGRISRGRGGPCQLHGHFQRRRLDGDADGYSAG